MVCIFLIMMILETTRFFSFCFKNFFIPLHAFNSQNKLANTIKRGYNKKSYNRVMRRIWNDGLRFQLAHYTLSSRKDTQFWIDSQKGADENSIWDNYQKYTGSYQWIFPDGVWAQMGVYLNKMDQYAPKLQNYR